MLTHIKKSAASRPLLLGCLIGSAVMGLAQMAGAYTSNNPSAGTSTETCAFTQQLQSSVSVRRQYLVKVEQVLGRSSGSASAVEDMYGSIQQAAYSPDAEAEASAPSQTGSFSFGFASPKTNRLVNIDSFSTDCISCHDGVSASSVGVVLRNDAIGRRSQVNSFTNDHPIGMNYSNYVAVDRGFKPVMGNKMIFVAGRVGCLTCHDPLNPEKGHLVMSDRDSALCHTCHNK